MIKTFTNSDVLKYIYKQLKTEEKINFENELLINSGLKCQYDDYLFILNEIEKININPNKNVLDKIKSFSNSYNLPLQCELSE